MRHNPTENFTDSSAIFHQFYKRPTPSRHKTKLHLGPIRHGYRCPQPYQTLRNLNGAHQPSSPCYNGYNRDKGYGAYPLSARFCEPPARLRRAGQLNHNCGSTIDFINLSTLPVQHIEYANPPVLPNRIPHPRSPYRPSERDRPNIVAAMREFRVPE